MKTSFLLTLLIPVLMQVGNWFKNKDSNSIGKDDATGNLLIALAPALSAIVSGNENAFKKSLIVVRDTIDGYLGSG